MVRSKSVQARGGVEWRIRRRWAPRPRWRGARNVWPRTRRGAKQAWPVWDAILDPSSWFDADAIAFVLVVIAVIAFVVFMIFVGVPLLIFLVDTLLIVPILAVGGILGRVFLGRPWTMEASTAGPPPERIEWKVVGWAASDRAAAHMSGTLKATGGLPGDLLIGRPVTRKRGRP